MHPWFHSLHKAGWKGVPHAALSQQECCDPMLAVQSSVAVSAPHSACPRGTAKPLMPSCSPGATAVSPHTVPGRRVQAWSTAPLLSGLVLTPAGGLAPCSSIQPALPKHCSYGCRGTQGMIPGGNSAAWYPTGENLV